ncbi:hypothetical protein C8R43DRAFT_944846 [Mycena crocata]|nr:hypothetical protein C8R43DRAFT_944846 [Mycena crocata]
MQIIDVDDDEPFSVADWIGWLDNARAKSASEDIHVVGDEAHTLLEKLGWNAPLPYLEGTTSTVDLQQFLGSVYVKTNGVDIMMEDLEASVALDPGVADVRVARLAFEQEILRSTKGEFTKSRFPLLHRYEREVKEGKKTKLVFPANVANCHSVTGVIHFNKKTIDFGDSLPGFFAPPKKLIRGLEKWLLERFGRKPSVGYDGLEHGVQKDGFSCAIVQNNTARKAVYPETAIWIPRSSVETRIRHFLRYTKNQIQEPERPEKPSAEPKSSGIRITDLLNPSTDHSSVICVFRHEFSDTDVLLGRAQWSDDDPLDDSSVALSEAPDDDETDQRCSTAYLWDHMSVDADLNGDAGSKVFAADESGRSAMDVEPRDVVPTAAEIPAQSEKSKKGGLVGWLKMKPKEASAKRKRSPSVATEGSGNSTAARAVLTEKKAKQDSPPSPPHVRISRSAKNSREAKEAAARGELDPDRRADFETRIRGFDEHAEFEADNPRSVRHSQCGKSYLVKDPYDSTRFGAHVAECKKKRAAAPAESKSASKNKKKSTFGAGMSTIKSLFNNSTSIPKKTTQSKPPKVFADEPCPGITEDDIPNVQRYLQRSGAMGGGSRVHGRCSQSRWRDLKWLSAGWIANLSMWRNDHGHLRIFSTAVQRCPAGTDELVHAPLALPSSLGKRSSEH